MNPPAVIFGGWAMGSSATRSLGEQGIPVYVLNGGDDYLRHSRYTTAFIDVGSGEGMQDRWLEWLETGPRGAALLPCNDDGVELIARNRNLLLDWGYLPVEGNDSAMITMLDKDRCYDLARELGLSAPTIVPLREAGDLANVPEDILYPCGLKPMHTHEFARHFGGRLKVIVVNDRSELEAKWVEMQKRGLEMMVTEIVQGPDNRLWGYYSYLDEHGRPLVEFINRKLRQYPVHFGRGCYVVSDWDDEVVDASLRLLRATDYLGPSHVEWKRDVRDNRLRLIEVNARFALHNEQMRACGKDLTLVAYNRLVGRPVAAPTPVRKGVRLWYPGTDVQALFDYRSRGEITFRTWLRSLIAHRKHFPVFKWYDPMPTIVAHGRIVIGRVNKLLGRSSGTSGPPRSA